MSLQLLTVQSVNVQYSVEGNILNAFQEGWTVELANMYISAQRPWMHKDQEHKCKQYP